MNVLTFDIEEWVIEKDHYGDRAERYNVFNGVLSRVLDKLDETQCKATFFCLGRMATDFPEIVKSIHARGHHIGCHSHQHLWCNKLTREELLVDTRLAVDAIEQCIGEKVNAYRAPAFSIGKENSWALEVLVQNGIEIDASVFPASRDFGGFQDFGEKKPTIISVAGCEIKEMPIRTAKLLGRDMAFSGGGYFRFFPYSYIDKQISRSDYTMTYFHIGDFLIESNGMMSRAEYENYFKEKGSLVNRAKRYIKSNLGRANALQKLFTLVDAHTFVSVAEANAKIEWSKARKIIL